MRLHRDLLLSLALLLLGAGCEVDQDLGSDRRDGALDANAALSDAGAADVSSSPDGGCPAGRIFCAGECVDPLSSLLHCGMCDRRCVFGQQICLFGACSTCVRGSNCDNACVYLYSDPQHCGACTKVCPPGSTCANGGCQ